MSEPTRRFDWTMWLLVLLLAAYLGWKWAGANHRIAVLESENRDLAAQVQASASYQPRVRCAENQMECECPSYGDYADYDGPEPSREEMIEMLRDEIGEGD